MTQNTITRFVCLCQLLRLLIYRSLKTSFSFQICNDMQPVMRVFKTSLYKKEVMYVVLVHSPNDNNNKIYNFEQYPILPDEPNPICAYKDGCFIWRPQAMCGEKR